MRRGAWRWLSALGANVLPSPPSESLDVFVFRLSPLVFHIRLSHTCVSICVSYVCLHMCLIRVSLCVYHLHVYTRPCIYV